MAAPLLDEFIREELLRLHVEMICVSDEAVEVCVRELLRLDEMMQVRGRIVAHRLQVVWLEYPQHFESGDALIVRRQLPDAVTLERNRDRRDPARSIPLEIVQREEPFQLTESRDDALTDRPSIESCDAAIGNRLQRSRIVRIAKPFAGLWRASSGQERRCRTRVLLEKVGLVRPLRCNDRRDRKSIPCIFDRRIQRLRQRVSTVSADQ